MYKLSIPALFILFISACTPSKEELSRYKQQREQVRQYNQVMNFIRDDITYLTQLSNSFLKTYNLKIINQLLEKHPNLIQNLSKTESLLTHFKDRLTLTEKNLVKEYIRHAKEVLSKQKLFQQIKQDIQIQFESVDVSTTVHDDGTYSTSEDKELLFYQIHNTSGLHLYSPIATVDLLDKNNNIVCKIKNAELHLIQNGKQSTSKIPLSSQCINKAENIVDALFEIIRFEML